MLSVLRRTTRASAYEAPAFFAASRARARTSSIAGAGTVKGPASGTGRGGGVPVDVVIAGFGGSPHPVSAAIAEPPRNVRRVVHPVKRVDVDMGPARYHHPLRRCEGAG